MLTSCSTSHTQAPSRAGTEGQGAAPTHTTEAARASRETPAAAAAAAAAATAAAGAGAAAGSAAGRRCEATEVQWWVLLFRVMEAMPHAVEVVLPSL